MLKPEMMEALRGNVQMAVAKLAYPEMRVHGDQRKIWLGVAAGCVAAGGAVVGLADAYASSASEAMNVPSGQFGLWIDTSRLPAMPMVETAGESRSVFEFTADQIASAEATVSPLALASGISRVIHRRSRRG